ncbi:hypothetical protein ACJEQL_04765 [Klebsiella pneumoniae]|uniref:hypothetical protein n=1 Tax=Klebsiella pneumoniae TaxID=573 RepID=UPI003871F88D
MTTDITELAQLITERKFHDWSQSVMHDCDFCNKWSLTVKHENGERICASCCDDEYTSKLEVANAALVEALEKAQQVDEELCKLLPPGAEYMDPPDGGDVTPLEGVRRMVADYRQRIAELEDYAEAEAVGADKVAENAVYWMKRCKELESRTVKLPDGWQFEECEIEGCENGAILSVGTGSRNIHLCDKCAHEPQNSRLKKSPLSKRLPFKMSAGIKVEDE